MLIFPCCLSLSCKQLCGYPEIKFPWHMRWYLSLTCLQTCLKMSPVMGNFKYLASIHTGAAKGFAVLNKYYLKTDELVMYCCAMITYKWRCCFVLLVKILTSSAFHSGVMDLHLLYSFQILVSTCNSASTNHSQSQSVSIWSICSLFLSINQHCYTWIFG